MKKYWKAIGITLVAGAALAYPAYKLYQYLARRKDEANADENAEDHHVVKAFVPAYRGKKHKPHHDHN